MIAGGNATIYVEDMDRAVDFYVATLGLALEQRWGNHWAQLKAGSGMTIGLHPRSAQAPPPGTPGSISVGFLLDEPIDDVVKRLARKGVAFRGPVVSDAKAGIALAFFGDPDGNSLYLCELKRAF